MFRVYAVIDRERPPYLTMMEDAALMLRLITSAQMCFYTMLFAVKLSLLTLYRKLLAGLPGVYKKVWWGIVAFCLLVSRQMHTWVSCIDRYSGLVRQCLQQYLYLRQFEGEVPEGQMWRNSK
jgi:hypothetical protein